jgi:hypothetical protein
VQQAGVTLSMSGYAVEAAQALDQAANAYEKKDNDRLAVLWFLPRISECRRCCYHFAGLEADCQWLGFSFYWGGK